MIYKNEVDSAEDVPKCLLVVEGSCSMPFLVKDMENDFFPFFFARPVQDLSACLMCSCANSGVLKSGNSVRDPTAG
jgi:hypothetical protein